MFQSMLEMQLLYRQHRFDSCVSSMDMRHKRTTDAAKAPGEERINFETQ